DTRGRLATHDLAENAILGRGRHRRTSLFRGRPQDVLRDDELLNLVRAFVEAEDSRVAEVPLHIELAAESVAAVHLNGPVRDPLGDLGPVQLGHRYLERVILTQIPEVRGTEGEESCRVNLDCRLRDHLPHELEVSDRAPERLSFLHVLRRGLEGRPGHADGPGRDADPTAVQRPHRLIPAVALLADQVLLWNAAILEGQV